MNVLLSFIICMPLVLTSNVGDIPLYNEGDNDFVNIETIEDYEGNVVPSVDDEFVDEPVEDSTSEGVTDDSVVEQITVNQTVVDNTEVLQKMDMLDNKLSLLNNSFNSVLSSSPSSTELSPVYTGNGFIKYTNENYKIYNEQGSVFVYDVSDLETFAVNVSRTNTYFPILFFTDYPSTDMNVLLNPDLSYRINYVSNVQVYDVTKYNYAMVSVNSSFTSYSIFTYDNLSGNEPVQPDDPSGNDPSNPSINVTYPQEVINNVNTIKNELVTLQYLTVLNITLPMIIACVKRITFPNRKEINK